MKYWLSNGDGQVYGPYTVGELRGFVGDGRVTGSSQLCQEGTNDWVSATAMLGVGLAGVPPTAPTAVSPSGFLSGASEFWQPVGIVLPILSILLCCLPAGIVSLVYATNANTKAAAGNMTGAEADKTGFDATAYWARSGLMDLVRADHTAPPARSVSGMGDHPSAMAQMKAEYSVLIRYCASARA